jgi:mevalonate kinase
MATNPVSITTKPEATAPSTGCGCGGCGCGTAEARDDA